MNLQLLYSGWEEGAGVPICLLPQYKFFCPEEEHILLTFISGLILSELECTEELKSDHVSRGTVPEILLSRICILLIKGCYSMV